MKTKIIHKYFTKSREVNTEKQENYHKLFIMINSDLIDHKHYSIVSVSDHIMSLARNLKYLILAYHTCGKNYYGSRKMYVKIWDLCY